MSTDFNISGQRVALLMHFRGTGFGFVLAIVLLPFSASIDTHLCIVLLTHF